MSDGHDNTGAEHVHADGHGDEAHDHGAHGDDHGHGDAHHHPFSIAATMLHHNMPYPAMEWVHGKPIITFDRATYAAMNFETLSHDPAFAEVDGSAYIEWAAERLEVNDFAGRWNNQTLEKDQLAKAMALVDDHSFVTFPKALSFLNQQTFFGCFALLLLALFTAVVFRRKPEQLKPAGRVQHALEAITLYLRDEVVRPNIPHHPDRWIGFLVTMFLMILSVNLFGLIPGTGTMSGNIGVTGAFAGVTLFCMLFFGMKEQGLKFWPNLVPIHFSIGMSPIWLLLLIIELLGLVIKPFALAVRLFANMFAGHTVLLVFMSLGYVIVAQTGEHSALAYGFHGAGFFMAVAFHAMELLVAFIQAYVFTMLSAMFIGMSIHPEH